MSRVAIIGAGSLVFTKQFLNDMFNTPCMAGSTYMLMGPTMWKLDKMKQYADQIIKKIMLMLILYVQQTEEKL